MKLLYILLVPILLFSCTNENKKKGVISESDSTIVINTDSLRGIVFKPNFTWTYGYNRRYSISEFMPKSFKKGWIPDVEGIFAFGKAFYNYWLGAKTDSLARLNKKTPILWKQIDHLKRQYVGYIDSINGNSLWVNIFAFDSTSNVWQTELVHVDDGGPFSYEIIYNVDKDSIASVKAY